MYFQLIFIFGKQRNIFSGVTKHSSIDFWWQFEDCRHLRASSSSQRLTTKADLLHVCCKLEFVLLLPVSSSSGNSQEEPFKLFFKCNLVFKLLHETFIGRIKREKEWQVNFLRSIYVALVKDLGQYLSLQFYRLFHINLLI